MKINEFAIVDPKVDEAPQGILKRTGLGIAKAFGSDKAAGKLETGKMANLIKKAFNKHLGASGREANAEELIKFLKINKYPTAGVEKMAQDMANKEKAKTMQTGPMGNNQQGGPEESVEEAELKGSQIDKLIMKAATDAYDVKSGYGGTGLDGLGGDNTKDLKKATTNLKGVTNTKNVEIQTRAIQKLANGEILKGQEVKAIAPLMKQIAGVLSQDKGVNILKNAIKQAQKS